MTKFFILDVRQGSENASDTNLLVFENWIFLKETMFRIYLEMFWVENFRSKYSLQRRVKNSRTHLRWSALQQ